MEHDTVMYKNNDSRIGRQINVQSYIHMSTTIPAAALLGDFTILCLDGDP